MVLTDLSRLYDDHYFRRFKGAPYERSGVWRALFEAIADGIVREINPQTSLDVGCAIGLLVEALRKRGVEAYGFDFSEHAIEQVGEDVKPYCWTGSVLDAPSRKYDLVTCIEVLEHLPPQDAEAAVENLCKISNDVLFSSTPDDFAEDTHLNVRPMAYWAGLFAKHGFVRDVDFDGLAINHPPAVRFRRTSEPTHRILANYERRFSALFQENAALRVRALETKMLLAEQERALADQSSSSDDVAVLKQTIAEQAVHIDALTERVTYMSDRESDLRTMLHDAHEQLLLRDESIIPLRRELDERGKVIETLDQAVKERTAWAERMVAEAEARGQIIAELQGTVRELSKHQDTAAAYAEGDRSTVEALQRLVQERTAWAERMVAEAEACGRVIDNLVARQAPPSKEAQALIARIDRPAVRRLVRGYRWIRRKVRS